MVMLLRNRHIRIFLLFAIVSFIGGASTSCISSQTSQTANLMSEWRIGIFDELSDEFGGYEFPSILYYNVPNNWESKRFWKDFPNGQQAWKTDDTHPENSNGIELIFMAPAGKYVLTIGQLATGEPETVEVLLDDNVVLSFVTKTTNIKHTINLELKEDGKHIITLDRFQGGNGYQFDAIGFKPTD